MCMNNNEKKTRTLKFNDMKKNGFYFPNDFKKTSNIKKINKKYQSKTRLEIEELKLKFSITGRIIQKRIMGNASFFTIQEMDSTIQLYIQEKIIIYQGYHQHYKKWDIGDILATTGNLFKTKTGELSIFCKELYILNKSLKPLPDKFHGLENQEKRYRKRYLDFISNIQLFDIFKKRSNIISKIRNFMIKNNFLEVETPMLQHIPGGALARPFITYHNELNLKMYLRIAPELYLKQLIIGGFERVFELNRNFRNEGISTSHNPEFTMMEAYIAYHNYKDIMKFIEKLFHTLLDFVFKKKQIKYNQYLLNFHSPFLTLKMTDAIIKFNSNIKKEDFNDFNKMQKIAESLKINVEKKWKTGHIINEIFEKTVEKKLIQPTFITHYPIEVSPLSKRNINNANLADRFELFIAGFEIANGFSELNDVDDQKDRFLKQIKESKKEDKKNIFYDANYVEALCYGLPPTAGFGIGIDRLIMILTNQKNIRDVILFPTLRPLKN